jgi:hypothetical protein
MRASLILAATLLAIGAAAARAAGAENPAAEPPSASLDAAAGERFAQLALKCLHQEYPNHLSHTLVSDADARPPRELTPAFYGCYDWHSDVHAHWLLVRLAQLFPDAPFTPEVRAAIELSLTPKNIGGEVAYLRREDHASFERPYGLAWLLQLCAELRRWNDAQASRWSSVLQPLEREAANRLENWVGRLRYPNRTGEHDQTALALSLAWDWAGSADDPQMRSVLAYAARRFYLADRKCPLNYEPSGEDFLSPCLAEADFMRRVLGAEAFARWLSDFLPDIPSRSDTLWLQPAAAIERADPKLAHTDGLNLSRAWMLEGIAHGLPAHDRRIAVLRAAARLHRDTSLPAVTGEYYEGGHWLPAFAVYLTSEAGLR